MNLKKQNLKLTALAGLAALSLASSASAAVVVLDFEGLADGSTVGNYYDGGGGGNYGINFSANSLALVDSDAGGGGNFGGEPSPSTIVFFLSGGAATMDVTGGFTTGFSFYYSAINSPGTVTVWDGPGGTGNQLASLFLPVTPSNGGDPTGQFSPFFPIGVAFSGTAMSVDFGGTVNQIGFDNITLGRDTPGGVPDGGSTALMLSPVLLGLAAFGRKLRKR